MGSMATLNVKYSSLLRSRILSSPKHYMPECFTGKSVNSSSKHISLNYQHDQNKKSKAIFEIRASSSDEQYERDNDDPTAHAIEECIEYIKTMLSTMDGGRLSVSPYDTAWVALIKDLVGKDVPRFPSSLDWIQQHQLPDGSWGDEHFFCAYDRLINTLACVIALRSWNVHADKSEKGIRYIRENVCKLEDANTDHMPCGFEVVFPALLQKARNLGIEDLPYDAPIVRDVYNARDRKIKRIPMEVLHNMETTLLYSLEGLENLEWEKLLKLQATDGSFLSSPSSTAFAFMQTKDENCLKFIENTVQKFDGGAPHSFPMDLLTRLWAVDRLQRLGISRFFDSEISDILSYIYRHWNADKGIFSRSDQEIVDIDDTAMGFRLLRLHGYDIDPKVFRNFKNDDEKKFFCWGGEMIESPTPIYNLYRASQVRFPGEKILEQAENFAYDFLQDRVAKNQLLDKWFISKHLPDEIKIVLEMPWYASLPRVVTRYYLHQYGGGDDVWIGKVLYRMQEINNEVYMELARLDFNRCQAQHQIEWLYMQEWYADCNVKKFGISKKDLLLAYFLATATVFELESTKERFFWAKSQIVFRMIEFLLNKESTSLDQKTAFLTKYRNIINGLPKTESVNGDLEVVDILLETLHQLLNESNNYIMNLQLRNAWGEWLMKIEQGETSINEVEAEFLVTTSNICAGRIAFKEDILSHHEYKTLSTLTNKICRKLRQIQNEKVMEINEWNTTKEGIKKMEIEQDMQGLVKQVVETSGIDKRIKQTFMSIAKTFYYSAYFDHEIIGVHIFKVLFEPVI
ncbi:hypothetical protein ACP275_08G103000 [Erythranthe tilingii]